MRRRSGRGEKSVSRRRPKRLLYPPSLIARETKRLERDLLKIYREIRKKLITKEVALAEGNRRLEDHRRIVLEGFNAWAIKKGLTHLVPQEEKRLEEDLERAKTRWRRIVDDMY